MSRLITAERDLSHQGFLAGCVLLFAASAAATVAWCGSMSEMGGGMEMPGGWTMSMAWMRMPGQTWAGAAISFLGMWVVMMAAMMLPSLTPMLLRYRRGVGDVVASRARLAWLTVVVGCSYFAVWTLVGAMAFPLGAGLASLEMQDPAVARAVPLAVGVVVLIAGALQFTSWKSQQLACCRGEPRRGASALTARGREVNCCALPTPSLKATAGGAWRHGLLLGVRCSYCCAGLTAILLVIGVMDWRAMAVVTAVITAERLMPGGERGARAVRVAVGVASVGAGLWLIAQALAST